MEAEESNRVAEPCNILVPQEASKHAINDEIRKEQERQSNMESAGRSMIRKEQKQEQRKIVTTLRDKCTSHRNNLLCLSEKCLEIINENKSIEEELVKMYGPESIDYLRPKKKEEREESIYSRFPISHEACLTPSPVEAETMAQH